MTSAQIEALLTAHFALRTDPCDRLVDLVNARHDALDPDEAESLAAHLARCADCRRLAALLDAEVPSNTLPSPAGLTPPRARALGLAGVALTALAALALLVRPSTPPPPEPPEVVAIRIGGGWTADRSPPPKPKARLTPRAPRLVAIIELFIEDRPCPATPTPCPWSSAHETLTLYYQAPRAVYVAALIRDAEGDVSFLYRTTEGNPAPSTAGRGCYGGLCDLTGGLYDAPAGDAIVWIATSTDPLPLDALADALRGGTHHDLLGPDDHLQRHRLRIR